MNRSNNIKEALLFRKLDSGAFLRLRRCLNKFTSKIKIAAHNSRQRIEAKKNNPIQIMKSPDYQKMIVGEWNLIQDKKSTLSTKKRKQVEDQISFMVRNRIIKITV